MTETKKRIIPYFLLGALFLFAGVGEALRTGWFFPTLNPLWATGLSLLAGMALMFPAWGRWSRASAGESKAKELVSQMVGYRQAGASATDNDLDLAARNISRLTRNVDEDLREIGPDYSEKSILRLESTLSSILEEISNEESARIRLGVVGVYLGEFLCRSGQWRWDFKSDPSLRQFGYLASRVRRNGMDLDPFDWAGRLLTGEKKVRDFLREPR